MAEDAKPKRAPARRTAKPATKPKKGQSKKPPAAGDGKRKGGRPRIPFHGTDGDKVRLLVRAGTRQEVIAAMMGCSVDTLHRRFPEQMKAGLDEANALVSASLLDKAISGDLGSIVWWEKTRVGMRETTRHELTGADGAPIATETTVRLDALPLDDLRQLETILGKLGTASDAAAPPPA